MEGIHSIRQRLWNLLRTEAGQAPFQPDFGLNLAGFQDRNIPQASAVLKKEILDKTSRFIPSIIITNLEVLGDNPSGTLTVNISYTAASDLDTISITL